MSHCATGLIPRNPSENFQITCKIWLLWGFFFVQTAETCHHLISNACLNKLFNWNTNLALQSLLFERFNIISGQFLWFAIIYDVSVILACFFGLCEERMTNNNTQHNTLWQIYYINETGFLQSPVESSSVFFGFRRPSFPPASTSKVEPYSSPIAASKKIHCFSKMIFLRNKSRTSLIVRCR